MKEKEFTARVVKCRMPSKAAKSPSLKIYKTQRDGALSDLISFGNCSLALSRSVNKIIV